MGKKAVKPLVCVIEYAVKSDMSNENLEFFADKVEDLLVQIGEDALPDLEDFAANEYCTFYVNQCAQETVFKVLQIGGEDAQKVCKHVMTFVHKGGR